MEIEIEMVVEMTMMVAITSGDDGDDDDGAGLRSYLLICRRSYIIYVTEEEVHAFFFTAVGSLPINVVAGDRGKHQSV